jgi:hypothetical protein
VDARGPSAVRALLAQDRVVRAFRPDPVHDRALGGAVDLGDEVARPRFLFDLEPAFQALDVDLRCLLGEPNRERPDRLEIPRTPGVQDPTTLPKRTDLAGTLTSSPFRLRTM